MTPRPTLLLTDAERTRLCAEGFVSVKKAAGDLGYSENYVRELLRDGAMYHRRDRRPGTSRDSIRIPVVALREYRENLTPLRDQVVQARRAS